jgi:N-acyl-L-homoserine lactone synthetase
MTTELNLDFRIAQYDWEFEQIHRLNYKTFVEEIPQHAPNAERRLVDKFHAQNTYLTCWKGDQLVGMLCARDQRPFSLDDKLPNLDDYLPPHSKVFEIRLLAVEKEYRIPHVFRGLVLALGEWAKAGNYDLAIISGTTRQARLYRALAFQPFGPLTGTGDVQFQPMYLTPSGYEQLHQSTRTFAGLKLNIAGGKGQEAG